MESLICRGEKEMRGESTLNEKNTMEQGFVFKCHWVFKEGVPHVFIL
jgi:hypothetical protein